MTNKEILQADMLDILFEHRNKLYGAYALRKTYGNRLRLALGIALSIVLLFIIMSFVKNDKNSNKPFDNSNPFIVSEVDIPKEEIKEPPPPPEEARPETAQADHQQIVIAPDTEATEIPDQETITNSEVSNRNSDGEKATDIVQTNTESTGTGETTPKPVEEKEQVLLPPKAPSFPGGPDAWLAFLRRYLQSPEDLEPGQRIEVQVRFLIDVDGTISRPEIIKSGGGAFDKEVLRVLKKMPKWEPAMQNGNYVATPFTQPVIFIGVEQ